MSLTKQDFIDALQRRLGVAQHDAQALSLSILEHMIKALERGEPVNISSFGVFEPVLRKPRLGRNPRTKEEVTIAERAVVSFRPSIKLKTRMNKHLLESQKKSGNVKI